MTHFVREPFVVVRRYCTSPSLLARPCNRLGLKGWGSEGDGAKFFVFVRSVDRKNNALIGCSFLSGDFYARTRIYKECEVESEMSGFD